MSTTDSDTQGRRTKVARRKDRRDVAAPRLQYEALVEVGAEQVGGFEAESVDVSLDGMRMRTAYLPEIGDTLRCRFDGFGGEIVAEAEVMWCQAEARGGEFGIRFVGLDAHALTLLNDLCETDDEVPEDAAPSEPSGAQVGTRVRLHIEGLGSPMRARVRDAARGEVLIGSNLEFLKVGRGVELEDVDKGQRRIAHIEHVGVDIDKESNVPQLVVALSYEMRPATSDDPVDPVDQGELTTAPYRAKVARARAIEAEIASEIEAESTPEPSVIDRSGRPSPVEAFDAAELRSVRHRSARAEASLPAGSRSVRTAKVPPESVKATDPEPPPTLHAGDTDDIDENDEAMLPPSRLAARRAKEKMGSIARKLGPTFASASAGARGALGSILASVRTKHAARQEEKVKARTPKRTTAPPPSGALRSGGRRVLRDQKKRPAEPEVEAQGAAEEIEETSGRKRTVVTAVLAAAAVMAIYFGATHVRGMMGSPPEEAVVAAEPVATEAPAPQMPAFPGQPGGDATANVPLFGATPLSTTEAVPVPPEPGEAGVEGGEAGEAGEPGAAPAVAAGSLEKEWGVGEVEDPTVLVLKMNGTIDGISGTETQTGFTIVVPGRKSVSSASGLARKDKRLDAVNVVNYPDRAEVTLHFKKDVPAFMVKAKGKRLIVEIATAKKAKAKTKKKK